MVSLNLPFQACRLPGLPGPDLGDFLYAQKVTKKAPGRPWTPVFAQSVSIRFDTAQPLKYLFASGSLVIGAVSIQLRLTALVLRCVPYNAKTDTFISLTGRQPKSDKQPGRDQMLKKGISVAAQHLLCRRPIGQKRGSSPKGAGVFLGTFCTSKKYPARGCGNPQSRRPFPAGSEAPAGGHRQKRGAPQRSS